MYENIMTQGNIGSALQKKRRVLVIEDNKGLNTLAQKVLDRAGFETEGVLTGADALERILSNPELTLLVDQQLPDMKGTELISTLIKKNRKVPFVAMTGNGDEAVAIEMMKLGARDYLIKEFGFTDLLPKAFQRMSHELNTEERLEAAEKSLRQSEERFKLAMEATQDGLWDWNVENNEVYLNPGFSSMLGYTPDLFELDSNTTNSGVHPDDKVMLSRAYRDCVENHTDVFELEYRLKDRTGKWLWVLGRGKVVARKESGKATRMVGTFTNITRRKLVETELSSQAERLNIIFNNAPNILTLVNEEDRIVKINRKGVVFSGKKESDLVGQLGGTAFCCIHSLEGLGCGTTPNCSSCPMRTRVEATFQTGNPHHEEEGEMTFLINNKRTTLYLLISTVLLEMGESQNVLLTLTDITDLKRAEFERQELEKQLHHSQKMLSIGTLAGGIAHDFNNILTAILGYTEMVKFRAKLDTEASEDLTEVIKAGNRAKDLVQQILTFSRQRNTKRIPLEPVRAVAEVVKMLRPTLPSTVVINHDSCQATGFVLADPTQFHQIILNICTNANQAMEEVGGVLDISLKETILSEEDVTCKPNVMAGTYIQISISDTGRGIEKANIDRIFDPYFTTKEMAKGTGMGLAIVHGIVLSYGGFVSVDSILGEGSTFQIYLPVIDKEPLPATCPSEQVLAGEERILFVDDEELIARMSKKMLERLGYSITAKTSSVEALETFQNQPDLFDLVITDQTMPGMTGADMARRMIQIRPDIPIILCTGYSAVISEEKAKSMGIKEFAMKPLSNKDLAVLIRKVLDKS